MANRIPAEVFAPGEYVQDELDARGWTQQDLAQILNRPANAVSQIISGKRSVTPETAKGLAAAFGTSPEFWMNLDGAFQLSQVKTESDDVAKRAELFSIAPVNEMVRRGWIVPGDVSAIESQLKIFFGTDNLATISPLKIAARKSTSYEETTVPQRAWAFRAPQLARSTEAASFNSKALSDDITSLRSLTIYPENLRKLPVLLSKLGIRLVLISHLEKTKIDGATLWLDDKSPVVAMSLRFDRIDYFWHTLIHELIHVRNGDYSIDSDLVPDAKGDGGIVAVDENEAKVNLEAASILVPQEKLESFIIRTRPLFSRDRIVRFSQANSVHPGIVLGQLHHRKEIHPKNLRDLLVPVKHLLLGAAITDGWGSQPGAF